MSEPNEERSTECECCSFEGAELKLYRGGPALLHESPKADRWLCDLCAGTMTSEFDEYPGQHNSDLLQVMKTICYVGNAILAAKTKAVSR